MAPSFNSDSLLKKAVLRANADRRHETKIELRKETEGKKRSAQGQEPLQNNDVDDRNKQKVGSKWLKEYIRKKPFRWSFITFKDKLNLHQFFSITLPKHKRPSIYDLGIDAQNIIDKYNTRAHRDAQREALERRRAIEARGETRPEWEILSEIEETDMEI
ncbi:MAG: hypothetical protein Q9191_006002 [Dirinaria sp. TL-2023a]